MKLWLVCAVVLCFALAPPSAFASVVVNEIAWMGTANSANDEWIELYNDGSEEVVLDGWSLVAEDGSPAITLTGRVGARGYFLLERTDDESVPGVSADMIYTGALGNAGELLRLKNGSGSVVDTVDATSGWPAGDNTTKETMQRRLAGVWITAPGTSRAVNAGTVSQEQQDVPAEKEKESSNKTSAVGSSGGASPTYVPPEKLPRITAYAGRDIDAVVGEEISFYGEAYGFSDDPLENARYLWNFGDADVREGQRVTHVYAFPGTYIVRLHVASGMHTAFDDVTVRVSRNAVAISEIVPGAGGWVELQNDGAHAVHVGGWAFIVRSLNRTFVLPAGMVIAPRSYAVLLSTTTYVPLSSGGDSVSMMYPNDTLADAVTYAFLVPPGKSVSRTGLDVFITSPTPGEVNEDLLSTRAVVIAPIKANIQQSKPVVLPVVQQEYADIATTTPATDLVAQSGEAAVAQSISRSYVREYAWLLLSIGVGVCAGGIYALVRKRVHQRTDMDLA